MAYKVLVVDDEIFIRRLVQVNLEKEGYIVEQAADGVEAIEKVKANKPDLIVLDVMMPRMDGFETLKALISDTNMASIPVIMLTAKASDKDVFSGWASGVSAYLTKPFNPRELLTFVERVLVGANDPVYDDMEKIYEI